MKKSLVIALALMLVLAFASSAMAAQALVNGSYLSTTATGMTRTGDSTGSAFSRTYQENKFTADGTTNYPYEIYLPNELSPENYRIHSNYAKNTDACASCHATHTAVGASLLQWYSVYETCMACHDGTLGTATYNVQDGEIGQTGNPAFGGMFGTGSGSESNHNVTGAMEIAAAPGGSTVAKNTSYGKPLDWEVEFGCASCHTPHGLGGNARILHPDPNYAAQARATAAGYSVTGITATETGTPNVFIATPGGLTVDSATYAVYDNYYFLAAYPYKTTVKINNNTYTQDNDYKVSNAKGYTEITLTNATAIADKALGVKIIGVPSMKVRMEVKNYLQPTEDVQHVSGMNAYCGACHTDYNTASSATYVASGYGAGTFRGSGKVETGTFTQAHRHQVGFQWHGDVAGLKFENGQMGVTAASNKYGMECLTCHVAHGTSQDYWANTLGGIVAADGSTWSATATDPAYAELAGSSALKRMPNMGTCEACHAKGTGSEGYNVNAGIVPAPTGNPGISDAISVVFTPLKANLIAKDWVGSAACEPCHKDYVEGWRETAHINTHGGSATSSCGVCHTPGRTQSSLSLALDPVFGYDSDSAHGTDAGITCEACHGSGKNHVTAPNKKNIYVPNGFTEEVFACSKCHDMKGEERAAKYNDTSVTTAIYYAALGHGGAYMYSTSKHYTQGIASCTTCHDVHNLSGATEATAGKLKLSYTQLCSSCHDSVGILADTMGPNLTSALKSGTFSTHNSPNGNYNHSFQFGMTVANNVYYAAGYGTSHSGYAGLSKYQAAAAGDAITVLQASQFNLFKHDATVAGSTYQAWEASGTNVMKADGVWSVTKADGTTVANVTLTLTNGYATSINVAAGAPVGTYYLKFKPTGNTVPLTINAFSVQ